MWRDVSSHAHMSKLCQEETTAMEFFLSFDFGDDVGKWFMMVIMKQQMYRGQSNGIASSVVSKEMKKQSGFVLFYESFKLFL